MYCEHCGQKNAEVAVRCIACGHLVSTLSQNVRVPVDEAGQAASVNVHAGVKADLALPRVVPERSGVGRDETALREKSPSDLLLLSVLLVPVLLATKLSLHTILMTSHIVGAARLCNYGLAVGAILAFLIDRFIFKYIYKYVMRGVKDPIFTVRCFAALLPLIFYGSIMIAAQAAAILSNDQFSTPPRTEKLKLVERKPWGDFPDKDGQYFLMVVVDGKPQKYRVCRDTAYHFNVSLTSFPVQVRTGFWGYKILDWQSPCLA